jgi:uncharacterized protein YciI
MGNPFLEPTTIYMYTLELLRPEIKTEGPTEAEAATVKRHWAHLQDLLESGKLIFAGRTLSILDNGFASIVFLAVSEEAAQAIMDRDPGIREGVFRGHLYPYQVLLMGNWSPDGREQRGDRRE